MSLEAVVTVSLVFADSIPLRLITFLSVTSTKSAAPDAPDLLCTVGNKSLSVNFLLSCVAEFAASKKSVELR